MARTKRYTPDYDAYELVSLSELEEQEYAKYPSADDYDRWEDRETWEIKK